MASFPSLNQIGQAFQGFGEGVQGRGTQFQAGIDQRAQLAEQTRQREGKERQAQELKRQQAMAQDMVSLNGFLTSGDTQSALAFIDNRLENIKALGGDPKNTLAIREKIVGGDTDGALQDLSVGMALAVSGGLLDRSALPITTIGKDKFLGTPVRRVGPDGKITLSGILHEADGNFRRLDIPLDGELLSTLGETAAGQTKRAIGQAGGIEQAKLDAQLEKQPIIGATTAAAKAAIQRSEKAFTTVGKIRTNVRNLDRVSELIDEGAGTGVINSMLPSFRAASVELDNLQGRLGLDVIGETTFGALSESELAFALRTALPTGLKGPELKAWVARKQAAQLKLVDYLEETASFLGTPGNTTAKWIKFQKAKKLVREENQRQGLPQGIVDNQDGTFTLPDGRKVRRTGG